jgi:HEAT repeat protein
LCGDDPRVRLEAAERLEALPRGWLEDHPLPRKKIAPLADRLARGVAGENSPLVREWCAQILAEVPSAKPEVVAALAWGLKQDDPSLLTVVVYAVGELGQDALATLPDLLRCAAHPDDEVRWRVAWALDRIGGMDQSAATTLRQMLRDGNPLVRGYAARAYAKSVNHAAHLLAELRPLLADSESFPRAEAERAMAEAGKPARRHRRE